MDVEKEQLCDVLHKNGGFVEQKRLISAEAVAVIEQILKAGKDVKISAQKDKIIIREISENKKLVVATV